VVSVLYPCKVSHMSLSYTFWVLVVSFQADLKWASNLSHKISSSLPTEVHQEGSTHCSSSSSWALTQSSMRGPLMYERVVSTLKKGNLTDLLLWFSRW
jgi:hypothetical protein